MIHLFKQGKNKRVLLLLHGTGGDESDLLQVGKIIDPEASLLSVRGNVVEQGMNRFFKRIRPGVFDLEDMQLQTIQLLEFLSDAAQTYHFSLDQVVPVGYSNGANIALSALMYHQAVFKQAILFHPMHPNKLETFKQLDHVKLFIGAGENDPMCPLEDTVLLIEGLQEAHAEVEVYWHAFGHQLIDTEVKSARKWLNR